MPGQALTPAEARARFFRTFPAVALPMFLAAVDQTIVATALPTIGGAFGDLERVAWLVIAYLLAATIAAPVYGRLGDMMGRRRMLFVALGVFALGSALCAAATSVPWLVAARAVQGLGGGGLLTLSQALIADAVPGRQRGAYQGYMAGVFLIASTCGPVLGGLLSQSLGWRAIFLVSLPGAALAALLALRLPQPLALARGRFDTLGLVLFVAAVLPALLALELLRGLSLATMPVALAMLAGAGVALLLLIRVEQRRFAPLIPVRFLARPEIWRVEAMAVCIGAVIVSGIAFVPMYLQIVRGLSPADSGLAMLPMTGLVAVGAFITGTTISRTGRTAILPSIGLPVVAAMWFCVAWWAGRAPLSLLPWMFGLAALFTATAMPVVQMTVQQLAPQRVLGSATASVQLARSLGAVTGTAIVGAVIFGVTGLRDPAAGAVFTSIVRDGQAALTTLEPAVAARARAAMGAGFSGGFAVLGGFALVGAVLAWGMKVRRL